jgi:hypothetical protein
MIYSLKNKPFPLTKNKLQKSINILSVLNWNNTIKITFILWSIR